MVDLLLYAWTLFFCAVLISVSLMMLFLPAAVLLWIASMIHDWRKR